MQEAAEVFNKSLKGTKAQVGEQHPTKEELKTLAEGVKLEASKIGLMWGSDAPTLSEAESLLAGLQHRHSQLLTLMYRASSAAGPTLLRTLKDTAAPVTEGCVDLISFLSSHDTVPEGQAATKTGLVWKACDAASMCSLDNKTALGKQFILISKGVKDNARETQEIVDSNRDSGSEADDLTSTDKAVDSLQDAVDLDFTDDSLSGPEYELAKAANVIIHAVLDLLKCLIRMLVRQEAMSQDSVDSWESLLFHAQKLADASNDLGAALYPPQDKEEIVEISNSIEVGVELMVDEIPDDLQVQHQETCLAIQSRMSAALAELTQSQDELG